MQCVVSRDATQRTHSTSVNARPVAGAWNLSLRLSPRKAKPIVSSHKKATAPTKQTAVSSHKKGTAPLKKQTMTPIKIAATDHKM